MNEDSIHEMDHERVVESTDVEMLMHRDTHFGGKFPVMIDYYETGGVGVQQEFSVERLKLLDAWESQEGEDLASMLLSGADAEKVMKSRKAYEQFQDLYELEDPKSQTARLIADLILSEDEEPDDEIEAIVKKGTDCVPLLLDLLNSIDFYDPIFPGYGRAPFLACRCLGKIHDPRSIEALFGALDKGDFFNEDEVISALNVMGKEAKGFLIQVLQGLPLSRDNERAAMVLSGFAPDEEIGQAALQTLQETGIFEHVALGNYLIYCCAGLQTNEDREKFKEIIRSDQTPSEARSEGEYLLDEWS